MEGTLVGSGQCVALVHATVAIPHTSAWRKGAKVKGNYAIARGTVIAVFGADGRYSNFVGGNSHAAIYLGQDGAGIRVMDQWNDKSRQTVHERTIGFRNGKGYRSDDGDQFKVVE